jgi:hypothetical protein
VERPTVICFNLFSTKLVVAGETGHVKQFDLKTSDALPEFAIQDCPIRYAEFAGPSLLTSVGSITNSHASLEAVRILDGETSARYFCASVPSASTTQPKGRPVLGYFLDHVEMGRDHFRQVSRS